MADRFSVMKRFDFKAPVKIFIKCAAAAVLSSAFILSGCSDKSAVSSDALPEIIIGSDEYEPYNFSDKNGNPAGIDVEIASEAFLRMGYKAQFKNIVWDEKDEMLTTGKVDCLWGCFSMNGREDKYRWVGPYMNSRQAVAVRADSNIYALSDLSGKKVAVQSSSKPEEMLSQKSDDIPQVSGLYCFVRTEYIFAALRKNYVDAVAGHEYMLRVFINESDDKYRLLDESLLMIVLDTSTVGSSPSRTLLAKSTYLIFLLLPKGKSQVDSAITSSPYFRSTCGVYIKLRSRTFA